jgi:uncharacterized repeat protein (TIGR02543 family)
VGNSSYPRLLSCELTHSIQRITQNVTAGGFVSEPADPILTGYLFGGWYSDAGLTTVWTFGSNKVTADMTLYAAWNSYTYTVTFDSQGADVDAVPSSIDVISPETTVGTLPTEPTLTGFYFGGWWTETGGGGTPFNETTTVPAPLTVYTFWSAVPSYTVTFEANGGSAVGSQVVPEGDLASDPGAPVRTGYAFDGWFTDNGTFTIPWLFATDTVTSDISLYAGWTANSYDIVFDADGGMGAMPLQPVNYDQTVTLNANSFTRTGYTFDGWSLSPGGPLDYSAGADYTHTTDGNVTLYARWIVNSYNIVFAPEGGTGTMADQPVDYNQTVTLNANTFTRTGYAFEGWSYTSGGAVDHVDSDTYTHTVASDRTLYAVWQEQFQITYTGLDADSGTPPNDPAWYTPGSIVTVLGNPGSLVRAGFSFAGWWDGVTVHPPGGTFVMPASNVTLDPWWGPETFTVTYDGNGHDLGTPPTDPMGYLETDTVTVLAHGTLEKLQDGISLRFTGWNTSSDGSGTPYLAGETFAMPAGNRTLFAQWDVLGGIGPGGGLVFHDKGSITDGWRYLEAAPVGTQFTTIWGDSTVETFTSDTAVGTGKHNSGTNVAIMQTYNGGWYASRQAEQVSSNGFTDWFLPSRDELQAMYLSLHTNGMGDFNDITYWSSSEGGMTGGLTFDFFTGTLNSEGKDIDEMVRAARAFRSLASTHLVIYDANGADGGTAPSDPYYYEPGETANILGQGTLALTGHSFTGWNTASDGSGTDYPPGATPAMPAANLTLYAQWTPNTYNLLFDPDGGAGTMTPVAVDYEEWIVLPVSTFTRIGYSFNGWAVTPAGPIIYVDGANYQHVTVGDETLYALWTPEPEFAGGDGSPGTPYQVATATHLDNVRNYLGAWFVQTANIDLGVSPWNESAGWEPIGTDVTPFTGTYDGGGLTISGLTIDRLENNVGLFGRIEGATIERVRLEGVSVFGLINTGALIGSSPLTLVSTIRDTSVTGTVTSSSYNVGGLIGFAGAMTIDRSFSAAAVESSLDGTNLRIGGLIGQSNDVIISDSYAVGPVTAPGTQGFIGGLLGAGIGTSINQSYAAGRVTTGGASAGGLVGDGADVNVTDAYYDTLTTGMTDTGNGFPRTTGEMVYEANLVGFNFTTTWINDEGNSYPYLQWQFGVNIPFPQEYAVGDTGPAGGIIFHKELDYSSGWRYLEASPVDLGPSSWSIAIPLDVPGTTLLMGAGPANTAAVVSVLNADLQTNQAAQLADDYDVNGFSDWFLPSRDELQTMWTTLNGEGLLGSFGGTVYWSSSQSDTDNAFGFNFGSGMPTSAGKTIATYSIRPVRRF